MAAPAPMAATMASNNVPITADTLITVKVSIQGITRKFKLPFRDLGPVVLPEKLRYLLAIPPNENVIFERYSDSAGVYTVLDPRNPHVYKTLIRAAKAKLKLRLRATIPSQFAVPTRGPVVAPDNATAPSPVNNVQTETQPTTVEKSAQDSESQPEPQPAARDLMQQIPGFHPAAFLPGLSPTPGRALPEPLIAGASTGGKGPMMKTVEEMSGLTGFLQARDLALRFKSTAAASSWSVYCNNCDAPMSDADAHFHCSICDEGDYDLCYRCVDAGVHCPGEGHWLIKRVVQNGHVVNSTTDKIAPKAKDCSKKEMPGAYTEEKKVEPEPVFLPTRTCNSCVRDFPEADCVTCTTCEDYDLCITCHVGDRHGHHPGHAFKPATEDGSIGAVAELLCNPGRNVRHSAICDGCDKSVRGVRHKCLDCPDWDYCSQCIKSASYIHPKHRFVPVYDPLPEPRLCTVVHYGVFCDGPLCKNKTHYSYIQGVRYKCAVCHDVDFCSSCEALPDNGHNGTHPLIKFKSSVRNVSVTTLGEDPHGVPMPSMGDCPYRRSTATETAPSALSANAATQIQTTPDVKPTAESVSKPSKEKIEIKDLLAEPIEEKAKGQEPLSPPQPAPKAVDQAKEGSDGPVETSTPKSVPPSDLNAHFVRDIVPDGTRMSPNKIFLQVWTLVNPGPYPWPAGCRVRFVGGDITRNVNQTGASGASGATDVGQATESNIIDRVVKVGEEVSFRVLMKSPQREGKAISYWRLKTADGVSFGHRLWCDINVVSQRLSDVLHLTQLPTASALGAPAVNTAAIYDYQTQLLKLEQQNKRRLMMARKAMNIPDATTLAEALSELPAKKEEAPAASPEAVSAPEPAQAAEEPAQLASSTMIFPKLDKESPASSVHEAAASTVATEAKPAESSEDKDDLFEDAESVQLSESDGVDDDESFMTDEEYDILDATDEDLV